MDTIDAIASRYPQLTLATSTGFTDLDMVIGGLRFGQLIVVAGYPSVGKTTLALGFARVCAVTHGRPCAYLNLEMDRTEVIMRVVAAESRLRMLDMRAGLMSDDDWTRMAGRIKEVADAPLYIDDEFPSGLDELEVKIRDNYTKYAIQMFVVDYVELSSEESDFRRISRRLKQVARSLGIAAVLVVAQIDMPSSPGRYIRPQLSDIRGGGLVENSDIILLLHRPDLFDLAHERAGEADLIVAKNRNGSTSTITVASQLHYGRFVEMAEF